MTNEEEYKKELARKTQKFEDLTINGGTARIKVPTLEQEVTTLSQSVGQISQEVAGLPEIPTPTAGDAGKVLKVDESGGYELGESSGGVDFVISEAIDSTTTTFKQLFELAGIDLSSEGQFVKNVMIPNHPVTGGSFSGMFGDLAKLTYFNQYGVRYLSIEYITNNASREPQKTVEYIEIRTTDENDTIQNGSLSNHYSLPSVGGLDTSKTYDLKCDQGSIVWSENLSVTIDPEITGWDGVTGEAIISQESEQKFLSLWSSRSPELEIKICVDGTWIKPTLIVPDNEGTYMALYNLISLADDGVIPISQLLLTITQDHVSITNTSNSIQLQPNL